MPVQGSHSKQKRPSSTLGSANSFDYWNKMCNMGSKPVVWSLTLVLRQVLGSLLPVALHKPRSFHCAKIYRKISFSLLSYLHWEQEVSLGSSQDLMSSPGNSKTDIAEDRNVSCCWCGLPPSAPGTSHKYFCENKILKQNQRCLCGTEPVTVVALQLVPLPPSVDSHRFGGSCPLNIHSFSLHLVFATIWVFLSPEAKRMGTIVHLSTPIRPGGTLRPGSRAKLHDSPQISPTPYFLASRLLRWDEIHDSPSLSKGWAACLSHLLHCSSFYHQGRLSICTWRSSCWLSFTVAVFPCSVCRQPSHTTLAPSFGIPLLLEPQALVEPHLAKPTPGDSDSLTALPLASLSIYLRALWSLNCSPFVPTVSHPPALTPF